MFFTIYGHGGHLEFQSITFLVNFVQPSYINAKYEISLKLAQYFHRSLEIFHEWLPWQPKLPCNFHKNFIYVNNTMSFIFV